MLYILFGADGFSLREELKKIEEGLGEGELLESNTTMFEGHQLRLGQLTDVCSAMPFLGSHRLVIVEGLLTRFEESAGEWLALKDFIAGMSQTTVLVLIDGQLKKDNPLLKELGPLAKVKEFRPLRGAALRQWIEGRVAKGGGTISPEALRLLAALVGENLWVLASEIEKLLLYASERRI